MIEEALHRVAVTISLGTRLLHKCIEASEWFSLRSGRESNPYPYVPSLWYRFDVPVAGTIIVALISCLEPVCVEFVAQSTTHDRPLHLACISIQIKIGQIHWYFFHKSDFLGPIKIAWLTDPARMCKLAASRTRSTLSWRRSRADLNYPLYARF